MQYVSSLLEDNPYYLPVILLLLGPVSLMHKNPQRCKIIIHGIHPIGRHRMQRKIIDRFEDFLVLYPVCVISVAVV